MIEIIMSLALLTIFFAAAGQVFHSSVMLSYDAPRLSNQASRIDSAVFQLRRDVWNSPQIFVPKPTSADLDSSEGKISWTISPDGDIARIDFRGRTERWNAIGRNWSLATDGICLMIRDGSAEMCLPSQILLSSGAHP
jgi:hypothetical protein